MKKRLHFHIHLDKFFLKMVHLCLKLGKLVLVLLEVELQTLIWNCKAFSIHLVGWWSKVKFIELSIDSSFMIKLSNSYDLSFHSLVHHNSNYWVFTTVILWLTTVSLKTHFKNFKKLSDLSFNFGFLGFCLQLHISSKLAYFEINWQIFFYNHSIFLK